MAKTKMEIDDLPSNSISSKIVPINESSSEIAIVATDETPIVKKKKKIKAIVKETKPSFAETFFGESAREVVMYVLYDVLIPAAKTTIQDMVTSGIEMFLFGEGGSSSRSRREGSHISYNNYYQRSSRRSHGSERSYSVRGSSRIDGISFESRESAKAALEAMLDLFDEYDQVSVADFYEIVGLNDRIIYTDRKIGWEENINRARVVSGRNGFVIDLPKPRELE